MKKGIIIVVTITEKDSIPLNRSFVQTVSMLSELFKTNGKFVLVASR